MGQVIVTDNVISFQYLNNEVKHYKLKYPFRLCKKK